VDIVAVGCMAGERAADAKDLVIGMSREYRVRTWIYVGRLNINTV